MRESQRQILEAPFNVIVFQLMISYYRVNAHSISMKPLLRFPQITVNYSLYYISSAPINYCHDYYGAASKKCMEISNREHHAHFTRVTLASLFLSLPNSRCCV